MPTYDYKCKTCGTVFEYQQKFADAPLTHSPKGLCNCDEPSEVVRVFSKNIGLVFKGTGFYQTDYTKKSASTPEKSEPAAPSACGTNACACATDTKAS